MANNADIGITLTANSTALEQALARVPLALDKIVDRLDKVEQKAKKADSALESMVRSTEKAAVASVGPGIDPASIRPAPNPMGMATALLGAAVAEMVGSQRNVNARNEAARLTQLGAGDAVREVKVNFTEDATLKNKDLEAALQGLAKRTGATIGTVAVAASNAFSAGADTNQDAINAVEAALRINPKDAAGAVTLSGRAIDMSTFTGQNDMRANMGFMVNLQKAARVKDIGALGATAIPAMASVMAAGDSPEQAGELYATINQLMKDERGMETGTATKTLANRLLNFLPDRKPGVDKEGRFRVPQEQIDAFKGMRSTTERIEFLQKNEELRRQFISRTPFEAGADTFIDQLLRGDKTAMAAQEKARKEINPLNAGQVGLFEAKVAELNQGKFQGAVAGDLAGQSAIEQFRLDVGGRQRTATARKLVEDTMNEVTSSPFQRHIQMTAFDYAVKKGIAPEQAATNMFGNMIKDAKQREQDRGYAANDTEKRMIRLLEEQADLMRKMLKENEDQTKLQSAPRSQKPISVPSAALNRSGS